MKQREIKFKGQRVDNNQWVYGYYVKDPQGNHRIYHQPFKEASSNTYHFVKGETVRQYTGLKDSEGKEVYEGDVMENVVDKGLFNWFVLFVDGSFVIKNIGVDGYISPIFHRLSQTMTQNRIVIGNIFEHPELLKGGDNV